MKSVLLHGSCLDYMPIIPSESVDLVVTDPPYLINYKTNRRKDKNHEFCSPITGDTDFKLIQNYIRECFRIMKDNTAMYMFCSPNTVDIFKKELERYFTIKNMIIWVKNNWTAGDLKAQFGKQYEILFLVNKGRKFFNGKRLSDVWFFDKITGKEQLHQNQKPLDLIEQCIEKHSNEGDIIFDGFMGSGTTGVACKKLKRKFLGIEISKKYYDLAKKKIGEV